MTAAIATVGPITVAIDANMFEFSHWKSSGIFMGISTRGQTCGNGLNSLNHELNAIGYGTLLGVDYYILRNSWGEDWGELFGHFLRKQSWQPSKKKRPGLFFKYRTNMSMICISNELWWLLTIF